MPTVFRARCGLAAVLVVAAGTLRCSLFTSLDGLSSPGTSDGSAPQEDAATSDAVAATDAATDGGDAGRWCDSLSPAPFFCDDFDDEGPLSRWPNKNERTGGSVVRDGTASLSSPNALLSTCPAAATACSAAVYLSSTDAKSKVRVAYDMRIEARDMSVAYAEINYITVAGASFPFNIYLRVYSDSPTSHNILTSEVDLPDGGVTPHDVELSGAPQFDAWTHVQVDLDLASTPHTLTATIDGTVAATQTLEPDLYSAGPLSVNVGVGYTGHPSTTDWRIRYDNVTIDW